MDTGRWRVVLVAMAMAAAGREAAAGGRECVIETRLHWVDVTSLAPFAYRVVAGEARRLLAENGICAAVARASAASVRGKGEIGVILLRTMGGSGEGRRVLGATRTRDVGNAAVWVYFDEVAGALGLAGRPKETWTALERMQVGRALGRVVAHEIVHVLLPDRPHDHAGLMAPSFGRRELATFVLETSPQLAADVRQMAAAR